MAIVAVAVLEPSAMLVAVIVTTPAEVGAVKVTATPERLVEIENPPPDIDPVEVNDQTTPRFVVSFVSVAARVVSCCVVVKPPRRGDTLTVILDPPDEDVVADAVFE
jgi:hypothetical protein